MERKRTVGEYRTIDLVLFAFMIAAGELLVVHAASRWFPDQLYVFSIVPVITAIVMMRWGPWAAVHAVLGGAAFCWASGAQASQYAVYCAGNLLGLGALAVLRVRGKERVRSSSMASVLFGLLTALLMQTGRALLVMENRMLPGMP